ncbi:replication protein [Escherichia coli]|nr:replication protein [Escherichia coli]
MKEWREEPYSLDELADYLDLSASARRSIDKHYGMGRNCHLFEMTRKWAYRAIRQGWPAFSQWLDAVIQRVEMYNASLPVPLSPPECRAIGKSIAKYTHRNFTPETFAQYVADTHTPEIQAKRGRKGGIAKGEAYDDKRSWRYVCWRMDILRKLLRRCWRFLLEPFETGKAENSLYQITAPFCRFFEQ